MGNGQTPCDGPGPHSTDPGPSPSIRHAVRGQNVALIDNRRFPYPCGKSEAKRKPQHDRRHAGVFVVFVSAVLASALSRLAAPAFATHRGLCPARRAEAPRRTGARRLATGTTRTAGEAATRGAGTSLSLWRGGCSTLSALTCHCHFPSLLRLQPTISSSDDSRYCGKHYKALWTESTRSFSV